MSAEGKRIGALYETFQRIARGEDLRRQHDTNSTACWCEPEILHPCEECPVEPGHVIANPHCWKCGGRGLVPCDASDHETCDEPHVIVHCCDDCGERRCICPAEELE